MKRRYRIGIIGYGNMGRGFAQEAARSDRWDIVTVCDVSPAARERAAKAHPQAHIHDQPDKVFADRSLHAVGLFTLADHRPRQIRQALAHGLHIIAEKPLAPDVATEWELLREIEASKQLVAVNLFNRNAWYHHKALEFIASGQIGDLAILRVRHMTPGLMPTEGHGPEGPVFHDCGMHYIDVARWYANSEYDRWHAQGACLWGWPQPWWINAHGRFKNGITFDVTQGFTFGQLAQERTQSCGFEAIGTFGLARFDHDFREVKLDLHGISQTHHLKGPYGDKKLDIMCDVVARSIDAGKNLGFPMARDAVIASDVAWAMYHAAAADQPAPIGTPDDMRRILEHRRVLAAQSLAYGMPSSVAQVAAEHSTAACSPIPNGPANGKTPPPPPLPNELLRCAPNATP